MCQIKPHLGRYGPTDELHAVLGHVQADALGHVLVEAAQQNRAHHDGDVEAHPLHEAAALQRDVRRAHHQRLAGRVGQREQVVTESVNRRQPKYIHNIQLNTWLYSTPSLRVCRGNAVVNRLQ